MQVPLWTMHILLYLTQKQHLRMATITFDVSKSVHKMARCWPLHSHAAKLIVNKLVKQFISHFSILFEIHSDQVKNFESPSFKAVCEFCEITKAYKTPYRPYSTGQVEGYSHTLLQVIRCYCVPTRKLWIKTLKNYVRC